MYVESRAELRREPRFLLKTLKSLPCVAFAVRGRVK